MAAPQVEFDGRTWIMVPQATGMLVQPGPVVIVSRKEVEGTIAKVERYQREGKATPSMEAKMAAFKQLIAED